MEESGIVTATLKTPSSPQVQSFGAQVGLKRTGYFLSEENNLNYILIQTFAVHRIGGGQQHLTPGT